MALYIQTAFKKSFSGSIYQVFALLTRNKIPALIMDTIFTAAYLSEACHPFSDSDLENLLDISWKNNRLSGVTGVLLYASGQFLQILEGDEQSVSRLLRHIENDPRHTRFRMVGTLNAQKRAFPDWSMGFKKITPDTLSGVLPGYNRILDDDEVSTSIPMKDLIYTFKLMTAS